MGILYAKGVLLSLGIGQTVCCVEGLVLTVVNACSPLFFLIIGALKLSAEKSIGNL